MSSAADLVAILEELLQQQSIFQLLQLIISTLAVFITSSTKTQVSNKY